METQSGLLTERGRARPIEPGFYTLKEVLVVRLWKIVYAGMLVGILAAPAGAQSMVMSLPRPSQRAVVSQRVGLTDVTITYHRPLVGGRKIWDGVVPYGQVWRAGANENTTIEFSDPVAAEGQALARGVYGLHMIPGAESWTVIFSKNATSWGSFTYDKAEDALRVDVKPRAVDFHEALTYDFDDVKPDSALVTLRWEKMAVPFRVAVSQETTLANVRAQFRNLPQYTWQGWNDAAQYCLNGKINFDEALKWADKSIEMEERFDNLMTKAGLLEALNRGGEATAARNRAMEAANPTQLYFYGRQLQAQKKANEALDVFRVTGKRFPENWVGHMAMARVNSAGGNFDGAVKEIRAAQAAGVPDVQKKRVDELLQMLEAKKDINN